MGNRQHLLDSVKKLLAQEDIDKGIFYKSSEYKNLRSYMKQEVIDKFEMKNKHKVRKLNAVEVCITPFGSEINPYRQLIYEEITRLEREWKLM